MLLYNSRGARDAGHEGRLCGLEPADAMLAHARSRDDVEWILGDLSSVDWGSAHGIGSFDLVVMTGHAFQVLLGDDEIRTALEVIRSLLTDDGRFAFETRNPAVRTWERWTPDNAVEVTGTEGVRVRMAHQVDTSIAADLVSFTATFTSDGWDEARSSRSTLRFLDADALRSFLSDAGLVISEQFGDWDRSPLTETSPEIITIARKAQRRASAVSMEGRVAARRGPAARERSEQERS